MTDELKIIDESQLEALRELNEPGEDDIVTELIDIFISHSPQTLDLLKESILKQDRQNINKLAHKLKGSCSNLGAELMRNHCQFLEENAETLDWEEVNNRSEEIEKAYHQVVDILEKKWRKPCGLVKEN
ncbi:MAG: Hpt domain-containing protein [Oligoflexales bacterium]